MFFSLRNYSAVCNRDELFCYALRKRFFRLKLLLPSFKLVSRARCIVFTKFNSGNIALGMFGVVEINYLINNGFL
jgi:hypothetical protein